jgi:serine/threonine protein kinase
MNAEEIFFAAIEITSAAEQSKYILHICGENNQLRNEVESLLRAHDRVGTFLQRPFVDLTDSRTTPDDPGHDNNRSGLKLGRYEIVRRLGSGGMGEVYLAHDVQLQREVGIKFLSSTYTSNAAWLRRFYQEAKLAGAVNHPNILTVYEIGQTNSVHFIVTEYIEGQTLRDRMAAKTMTLLENLETAIQIANALSAAHAANIVHRDLKPENIMIRSDGLLKVLDFGLARHLESSDKTQSSLFSDAGSSSKHISLPGSIMGTIHYMSPEQARGLPLDTRSDLFSAGVVLYEMLAGHLPFTGATPSDALVAILEHDPPPLAGETCKEPTELESLVNRLLHKDRNLRHQTAKQLSIELNQILKSLLRTSDTGNAPTVPTKIRSDVYSSTALVATSPTGDDLIRTEIPEVRYTCSGDVNIAYQVFGEGEMDLVFVMGWVSHLEWFWKEPSFARFLRCLGKLARVILFDKRGTGLSDRVPVRQLPTLDQRMDDVRAVMDAVDSQRAVLCGISEGGPMCALFAATYPHKTIALMMIGSYARRLWAHDYPWGVHEEDRGHFLDEIRRNWGGPVGIEDRAPSMAFDPKFRDWWATYLRMGASPGAALALTQMNAEIDIRPLLSIIQSPTLVVHRSEDRCLKVEEGRFLAQQIPGARFMEFPGDDHLPFVGDQESIIGAIEEFLAGVEETPGTRRLLATVLAISPVSVVPDASTLIDRPEQLERYRSLAHREVELFRGANLTICKDCLVATFDGPTRAIMAAMAINDSAQRLGLKLQAGLHTGECDIAGTSVKGNAVNFAQRISEIAVAHEIVVSSTIKDLVAGSGIRFSEHSSGECQVGSIVSKLFKVER